MKNRLLRLALTAALPIVLRKIQQRRRAAAS
jgi:hypothetical protein